MAYSKRSRQSRRKQRRWKRNIYRKIKRLNKRISAQNLGPVQYSTIEASRQIIANPSECAWDQFRLGYFSQIQDMFQNGITYLHLNDAGAGFATQTMAPGTTGASLWKDQMRIHIRRMVSQLTIRNNYNVPVWVQIYKLHCKNNLSTSETPTATINDGFNIMKGATGGDNDVLRYPSISRPFRRNYKILEKCTALLNPGDEMHKSMVIKPYSVSYRQHLQDAAGSENVDMPRGAKWFLIKLTGVLAHESDSTAVNFGRGEVDVMCVLKTTYRWSHSDRSLATWNEDAIIADLTNPAIRLGEDPAKETTPAAP